MRFTVISHLTVDGIMRSNGKPEPELNDGFQHGGWQVPYFHRDLDRLTADWFAAADAPARAPTSHMRRDSIIRRNWNTMIVFLFG